jgi:uncharacterized protein YyaL (SSP411 family)
MIRWEAWGAAAFARARAERKPVLLSLTATWCHACHRMDDETWSDPGVAAAVERSAVPVRVDADARPDVYARFHLGGLPSTALLTDAAEFVRGGTFLSPVQCLGFLDTSLADWRAGRLPAPRPEPAPRAAAGGESSSIAARLVDDVVERLRRRADLVHGGFGMAPKQPEPDAVTLLLRRGATGDRELIRIARLTLDAIAEHLVDPDDGGFFRYGAAADWSGPHTEKLAVDQAALICLYLEAAASLDEPRYADVARGALDHARRRLLDARGRGLASVAAVPALDEHGAPLIDARRFADAAAAMISAECAARAAGLGIDVDRELLASAPDGAIPHDLGASDGAVPHEIGTSAAAAALGAPPYETGPDASAAMIGARPREDGATAPAPPVTGLLDDQALSIIAALDDHATTGARASLDFALRVAAWSERHLLDAASGAFAASPAVRPAEPALPPMRPLIGNGRMALALSRLGTAAGRPDLTRLAHQVVESLAPRAARSPAGAALALAAFALASRDR